MMRYEILMLSVPEITRDETKDLELQLDRIIQGAGGQMISFERWGKYRLAYPVKKNEYGVYFLIRFEVENATEVLPTISTFFQVKVNDIIMRNMVARLDSEGSLEYQRPDSLEDVPSEDVTSLLKDGKSDDVVSESQEETAAFGAQ